MLYYPTTGLACKELGKFQNYVKSPVVMYI